MNAKIVTICVVPETGDSAGREVTCQRHVTRLSVRWLLLLYEHHLPQSTGTAAH